MNERDWGRLCGGLKKKKRSEMREDWSMHRTGVGYLFSEAHIGGELRKDQHCVRRISLSCVQVFLYQTQVKTVSEL